MSRTVQVYVGGLLILLLGTMGGIFISRSLDKAGAKAPQSSPAPDPAAAVARVESPYPTPIVATEADVRVCATSIKMYGDLAPLLEEGARGGGYGLSRGDSFILAAGADYLLKTSTQGSTLGIDSSAFAELVASRLNSNFVSDDGAVEILNALSTIERDCSSLGQPAADGF